MEKGDPQAKDIMLQLDIFLGLLLLFLSTALPVVVVPSSPIEPRNYFIRTSSATLSCEQTSITGRGEGALFLSVPCALSRLSCLSLSHIYLPSCVRPRECRCWTHLAGFSGPMGWSGPVRPFVVAFERIAGLCVRACVRVRARVCVPISCVIEKAIFAVFSLSLSLPLPHFVSLRLIAHPTPLLSSHSPPSRLKKTPKSRHTHSTLLLIALPLPIYVATLRPFRAEETPPLTAAHLTSHHRSAPPLPPAALEKHARTHACMYVCRSLD